MKPPSRARSGATSPSGPGLHPRNRHQGRYDFDALLARCPDLAAHFVITPLGARSIDFSCPASVRALNAALLLVQYGVQHWRLPEGYLCPPIPGRADYVHGLADLLATDRAGVIPRGSEVRALDIGTGANLIYPLIGHADYGWHFVGSDIDANALAAAAHHLECNPRFATAIELRQQGKPARIFDGVVKPGERFDVSLCNPPFHTSATDAARGSRRKWRNLGKSPSRRAPPALNFGGQSNELWCTGGETAFLRRMAEESATIPNTIRWFTSLVAKAEHLPPLRKRLHGLGAREVREVKMAQGNKQSRFLAWTFLEASQRARGLITAE